MQRNTQHAGGFDPDHFWREAALCLQRADAAAREQLRTQWLALARDYEALAVRATAISPPRQSGEPAPSSNP